MSAIRELLERIFPFLRAAEHRSLWVGLDASGRTTVRSIASVHRTCLLTAHVSIFPSHLFHVSSGAAQALYKLKLGEVVTTIPTIGFNVEELEHAGAKLVCWDTGGCDKIRPLFRHYFQGTEVLIWWIDSNDRERMTGPGSAQYEVHYTRYSTHQCPQLDDFVFCVLSPSQLGILAAEAELREYVKVCIIACNKQDLPNAMTCAEISAALDLPRIMANVPYPWHIVPVCATSGEGLHEMLDLAMRELRAARNAGGRDEGGAPPPPPPPPPAAADPAQDGLDEWLRVSDEPDDEFLARLDACTLTDWSHRTHLRIAWVRACSILFCMCICQQFDLIF